MAMIKCSECGRDISDKAISCVGCGNPISKSEVFDDNKINNQFDLGSVRPAFDWLKNRVFENAVIVTTQGKELLKPQSRKDEEAVDNLFLDGRKLHASLSESQKKCAMFKVALVCTIDVKYAELMRGKGDADKFLTYVDGQTLTVAVRNIFRSALNSIPPQIEAACNLSDAILSPTADERIHRLKAAIGIGGGAAGIGMIIAAVGSALGWGAGIVATVSAFFVGTSMAGPLGWGISGLAVAGIAAYFATSSNKNTDTERFLKVLKNSTSRAVDVIWPEHEQLLSEALNSDSGA